MNTLTFHITDIASNSVRAGATRIMLDVVIEGDNARIRIADNGCGIGLGIPFLIQNAEQTGGSVKIISQPGEGTEVTASFHTSHIDCPPWGDLAGTVAMLISGNPAINVCFTYRKGEHTFELSTKELQSIFEDIPLNHPKVILVIKEMLAENLK